MNIQQNISLKPYNTFGIDARAAHFVEIRSLEELQELLKTEGSSNKLVLSGGSNMLITEDLEQLVVYLNIKGKKVIEETHNSVLVEAMAGENWHEFVLWTLAQDYGGIENLSLIPGNCGTAPIQNIGAYGVELKDVFDSCEAVEVQTGRVKSFSREDCQFGYRDSFFKNAGKDRYIITSIRLNLTKNEHKLNTSYGAIESELQKQQIEKPTIKDVSEAVISIRQSKLPDPKLIGNSGSFFKNPVLSAEEFREFNQEHPRAPHYQVAEDEFKVPAGWLIEQCGLKGSRFGDAGVHKNQALVLVNYGSASGNEILDLADMIRETVLRKFGIEIVPEVNIISSIR
ncbi:UDP-N-acetylmuramate dehydrogenase [Poritiphilus flavus]|uniref:UDP-N-acetylenolpyruvoylglucosamine reductase n=1 Tax=Poritiphilus flavus TaxID=2697053 RepID=A0A6L9EAZ9_9FLAO|nr:UDP-N-acetylmuramate dehydrogenase [Poritiphilus flavus]NAS11751.1 UDP-N-acetylmuramate dehydrogenase [Poritiphilus flavus]